MKECIDYYKSAILDKLPVKACIAGGAIRDYVMYKRLKDSDIDLYVDDNESIDVLTRFFDRNANVRLHQTDMSICYDFDGVKVDLIRYKSFDSLEDIIKGFDFTACCAALDHTRFINHERFFSDVAKGLIILNESEEAIKAMKSDVSVLKRLQKYIQKGFFAPDETLLKISNILSEVPKDSFKIREYDRFVEAVPGVAPLEEQIRPNRIWREGIARFTTTQTINDRDVIVNPVQGEATEQQLLPLIDEETQINMDDEAADEHPTFNLNNEEDRIELGRRMAAPLIGRQITEEEREHIIFAPLTDEPQAGIRTIRFNDIFDRVNEEQVRTEEAQGIRFNHRAMMLDDDFGMEWPENDAEMNDRLHREQTEPNDLHGF